MKKFDGIYPEAVKNFLEENKLTWNKFSVILPKDQITMVSDFLKKKEVNLTELPLEEELLEIGFNRYQRILNNS